MGLSRRDKYGFASESVHRDTVDKLQEYESEGIREYWVIDHHVEKESAAFYVLDDHGRYWQVKTDRNGAYNSTVLANFWFKPNWLRANPQPSELEAFALIVGPDESIKTISQSRLIRNG